MPENSSNEWTIGQQGSTPQIKKQVGIKTMADLLFLPEAERSLMQWLLRQQSANLAEVAAFLAQDEAEAEKSLTELINQGFVRLQESDQQLRYQPCLASRRGRQVPSNIWNALES